jgi:hypothetical protein
VDNSDAIFETSLQCSNTPALGLDGNYAATKMLEYFGARSDIRTDVENELTGLQEASV